MAWMATALKNAFISSVRKAQVQKRADGDPTFAAATGVEKEAPGVLLSDTVTDAQLARAVGMLSRKQRDVFEANAAGKRYAEIAGELGINVNAVAKRLFDARARLRKILVAEQQESSS
jgi:DNA-directed RNA polymerase specialized sigma24 family protein